MARSDNGFLFGMTRLLPERKPFRLNYWSFVDFLTVAGAGCLHNALVAVFSVLLVLVSASAFAAHPEQAGTVPASQTAAPVFSWGGYVQAVGVLFFLMACLWLGVWVLRRSGRFSFMPRPGSLPRDALVMEAQLPVGPRKGLMVVRFLNKRLLLGVTDNRITLLSEVKADHERKEPDHSGDSHHPDVAGAPVGSDFSGILREEAGNQ